MSKLICPDCETKNYLDPYSFWNFKGKVKCAGCGAIWYIEEENYAMVRGPEQAEGPYDRLPGYAETKNWDPITDEGKVAPAPAARPKMALKPIPITRSIRGKPVAGRPLKPEELVNGRARYLVEGAGG